MVTAPQAWGEQFQGLGLTCDLATAAKILGIGRTTLFDMLRQGTFPLEVIRLNRVRRIRTADLFTYLNIIPPPTAAPAPPPPQAVPAQGQDAPHHGPPAA
jgi:Helix-turn-helix domain